MKKGRSLRLRANKRRGTPRKSSSPKNSSRAGIKLTARKALRVFVLVSFGLGIFGAYRWALASPYFRLQEVTVKGLEHLSRSDAIWTLAFPEGANLLELDLEDLRRRLEGHPWIRSVVLQRELPGRLQVEVKERRPAAVLQGKGGLLLDEEGTFLGRAGEGSERYPVLIAPLAKGASLDDFSEGSPPRGVEGLSIGLELLQLFDAFHPLGVRVKGVDLREGMTVTADIEGREGQTTRLRLGREELRQGLRRFGTLLSLWAKNPWPAEVDLSMGPRAVVRQGSERGRRN